MIEYEINDRFSKEVKEVLDDKEFAENFEDIHAQEIKIMTILSIKTDAKGEHLEGKGRPVRCKKISKEFQVITGGQYLITADYYFWEHANDLVKRAAIHHALMTIDIERSEKTGQLVLKTRKPDVMEFPETVEHFGAFSKPIIRMHDALKLSAKRFAESQKAKE